MSEKEKRKMKKLVKNLVAVGVILIALSAMVWAGESEIADPMVIGVGARPLGMGKAYVGVAENAETLFLNPAGLGRINDFKATSMYTNLMGDVNYMVLGGVYPNVMDGSVGGGFISSSVSDIALYDGSENYLGTGNWSQNVLFVSYGRKLENPYLSNLNVGGSLKYFNITGTGNATVEAGSGSGFDMDLSLLYSPSPIYSFGATAQNVLPSSVGAKITRKSGTEDGIPSSLKLGTKVNLMGQTGKALRTADQNLNLALDYDVNSTIPGATHVGLEYFPVKNMALRLGMDATNLTAGLGVVFQGVAFDYAYHPFSGLADDTTHFFSVSFVGEEKKANLKMTVISPEDKTIIRNSELLIKGEVSGGENLAVTVNGVNANTVNGTFETTIPVGKLGKKLVVVQATDASASKVEQTVRVLRLATYKDVPNNYWAVSAVEDTGTIGLVEGYPDQSFRPENGITRAELAALLVRNKGIPMLPVSDKVYKDVKADHWAASYIKTAKTYGLMIGYPKGLFKPDQKVSKAEVITAMVRLDKRPLMDKVLVDAYKDVKAKNWSAKYVLAARDGGMLDFVQGEYLNPKVPATRAESVSILAKTNLADVQIKELHSWMVGFKREVPGTADISFLAQ
jgi:hypothetical protein